MTRALVRVLYGEPNNPKHDYCGSRNRVDKDIRNVFKTQDTCEPFYTYVLGEKNFNYLKSVGIKNLVMANKEDYVFPGAGNYSNKVMGMKYALSDFDEIVFLDWDTVQTKPFPSDFWESFREKEVIQTPIYKCPRNVIDWRKVGRWRGKYLSSGSFVYMRDKTIPDKLIKMMEDPKIPNRWSDETFISKYTDDLSGGWEGIEKYFKNFEPKWCLLKRSVFRDKKDACFFHPIKGLRH